MLLLRYSAWLPSCSRRGRMAGAVPALAAAQPAGGGGGLPRESVWDYPRPPAVLPVPQRLKVLLGEQVIADTTAGFRVCETASPPTYYFPPESVNRALLRQSEGGTTFCEWKGSATYWDVAVPSAGGQAGQPSGQAGGTAPAGSTVVPRVAWSYESPTPAFQGIAGWLAFYARPPLECWVGEERVQPQEGQFYGGWVTSNIVGPVKGGPGTAGW